MSRKIIIAGGTGFLGKAISNRLPQRDFQIVVLTRTVAPATTGQIRYVHWDARRLGDWTAELEGAAAVINLVGKSVNCRYTEKNKQEIIRSRVDATRVLGQALQLVKTPPKVWINAGSLAIYRYSATEKLTESSPLGKDFSAEVCRQWEQAFFEAPLDAVRRVVLRTGVVLQSGTGLLLPFERLVKWGLGGRIGNGKQYLSWIHEADFLGIIEAAMIDDHYTGVFNCTSPHPVTNEVFMQELRRALGQRFGLPNPAALVRIGARLIGTEPELVLQGRYAISDKLNDTGYRFTYPRLKPALLNLYHQ
ncbi:TIGR01777 family oxidoreductase [Niabella terrae]